MLKQDSNRRSTCRSGGNRISLTFIQQNIHAHNNTNDAGQDWWTKKQQRQCLKPTVKASRYKFSEYNNKTALTQQSPKQLSEMQKKQKQTCVTCLSPATNTQTAVARRHWQHADTGSMPTLSYAASTHLSDLSTELLSVDGVVGKQLLCLLVQFGVLLLCLPPLLTQHNDVSDSDVINSSSCAFFVQVVALLSCLPPVSTTQWHHTDTHWYYT